MKWSWRPDKQDLIGWLSSIIEPWLGAITASLNGPGSKRIYDSISGATACSFLPVANVSIRKRCRGYRQISRPQPTY